jgi:hypothetical protein
MGSQTRASGPSDLEPESDVFRSNVVKQKVVRIYFTFQVQVYLVESDICLRPVIAFAKSEFQTFQDINMIRQASVPDSRRER